MSGLHFRLGKVRIRHEIPAALRLLAAVRRWIRDQGGEPSSREVDELLAERAMVSDG
jgi:hypothetical protein